MALGNADAGVLVDNGSTSNTIGGPVAGGRNFIAANADGVVVTGSATAGTVIAGNLIGTDVEGTAAVGNGAGISLEGGTGTMIGGATTLARNVISGNTGDGIDIAASATNRSSRATTSAQTRRAANLLPTAATGSRRAIRPALQSAAPRTGPAM